MTGSDPPPRHPAADPEADRRRIDEIDAQLKKARGTVEKPRQGAVVSQLGARGRAATAEVEALFREVLPDACAAGTRRPARKAG